MSDDDVRLSSVPKLTVDFVGQLLGRKVQCFSIKPGSAVGDNYMSTLYSLKCTLPAESGETETLYAISKCYPTHPARQEFLNKKNIFWHELCMYTVWIPALTLTRPDLKFPFAPFISGSAIDFGNWEEDEEMRKKYTTKNFSPFEIYIMMIDMKQTFGFRMIDRLIGFSHTEVVLVVKEYAKIHALSWIYKVKHGVDDLGVKFQFFRQKKREMTMWIQMMSGIFQDAINTLRGNVSANESEMLNGLIRIKHSLERIMKVNFDQTGHGCQLEEILRLKLHRSEDMKKSDAVPWQVVIHGDSWINNLLFRYDPNTEEAVEMALIDFQIMRQGCPTTDLACCIYSGTSPEFRKLYLDDMLRLYTDQFIAHCDASGVDYLPGFSFEVLRRRFHHSKLIGFVMAMIDTPAVFKNFEDQDMETCSVDSSLAEVLKSAMGPVGRCSNYQNWLYEIVKEFHNDGIL